MRARCIRSLAAIDADEAADARLLDAIADWCDRYTPLVGLDPPDGLFLDITGCAHLFGGEAELCRDLMRRLTAQGFHTRVAVADTPGCAWAVARYGVPLSAHSRESGNPDLLQDHYARLWVPAELIGPRTRVRGRTELRSPLPLAALRIDPDIAAPLAQAGLKTIGQLLDLPRAPLAARFRQGFVRRIDQALGIEDEPIVPRLPVPSFLAEQRFAEPIGREEDVLGTIVHLARELARAMERHGKGARRLQTALFRTDGKVARIDVGTSAPLREPERIRRLFIDRLATLGDEADPGFGFDVIRLSALAVERLDPVQTGLSDGDPAREIAHLIDRLMARFGGRAGATTHAAGHAYPGIGEPARCRRTGPRQETQSAPHDFAQDSHIPARPIRLFERPEPIEAIAQVPDGPPVQFKWRRVTHDVAYAEGPESIAMQWWRDDQGLARHARLFPRRKPAGRARLALSGGDLRRQGKSAALVPARDFRMSNVHPLPVKVRESDASDAPPPPRLCRIRRHHQFLLPARSLASRRTGGAGESSGPYRRSASPTAIRSRAWFAPMWWPRNKGLRLAVGARLVFADGTPDILAYPSDRAAWGTADAAAFDRQAESGEGRLHPASVRI